MHYGHYYRYGYPVGGTKPKYGNCVEDGCTKQARQSARCYEHHAKHWHPASVTLQSHVQAAEAMFLPGGTDDLAAVQGHDPLAYPSATFSDFS